MVRVDGRDIAVLGVFAIRPNVDSFVLDQDGTWLYYAPTTNAHIYRIQASALRDFSLTEQALEASVQTFASKPPSDGLAMDRAGTIYITNPEASAINTLDAQRQLSTLFQAPVLSWPDGFSFGPDNWLYVTNSSLHRVLLKNRQAILAAGPYRILRFKVSEGGLPGQ